MADDARQAQIDDIFVAPEIIVALEPECRDRRFMDFWIMDGLIGGVPFESGQIRRYPFFCDLILEELLFSYTILCHLRKNFGIAANLLHKHPFVIGK